MGRNTSQSINDCTREDTTGNLGASKEGEGRGRRRWQDDAQQINWEVKGGGEWVNDQRSAMTMTMTMARRRWWRQWLWRWQLGSISMDGGVQWRWHKKNSTIKLRGIKGVRITHKQSTTVGIIISDEEWHCCDKTRSSYTMNRFYYDDAHEAQSYTLRWCDTTHDVASAWPIWSK